MGEPVAPQQPPYPIACPKCDQITGQPYDVKMAGPNTPITVYIECEACKHRWTTDAPSPLIRRRDRRL